MPNRCIVGGCSNTTDKEKGISLHKFPFENDQRTEARKRRRQWVQFVQTKRRNRGGKEWQPTDSSRICSLHFKQEDFARLYSNQDLSDHSLHYQMRLKVDDIGIAAIPSVFTPAPQVQDEVSTQLSDRDRRSILKGIKKGISDAQTATTSTTTTAEHQDVTLTGDASMDLSATASPTIAETPLSACLNTVPDVCSQTPLSSRSCNDCQKLKDHNRRLRNTVITKTRKVKQMQLTIRKLKRVVKKKEKCLLEVKQSQPMSSTASWPAKGSNELSDENEDDEITEEEPPYILSDVESQTETYTESDSTSGTEAEQEENNTIQNSRKRVFDNSDSNMRTEPKYIVFLSQLLLLFQFCPVCKADNPVVRTRSVGTMVEVATSCCNLDCPQMSREKTWKSQPNMMGTKIAAGNFLLSLAILLAGGSASKVFQIFSHMGLGCISLTTFFEHQREKLFPTIYLHWKAYQESTFNKLKALGQPLVIAGDGRHDSMGHSAKYCAYTIFCCTLPLIIHFSLVQRNQAGSSPAMEYLGFQNCMTYLITSCGLAISTLITDRHTSIISHMRNKLTDIIHYFDLWHLKKKIRKVLTKIAVKSGGSVLYEWMKPCENHLIWSATSTISGNGKVIWAKFKSFLSHVVDKHDNLNDPLFNKCAHNENIQERKWLSEDSPVYEKMSAALTNLSLVKGIKQASPLAQTSCLEGFHSVLNHFAPKMIAYSFAGMFCRHILAAIHFNGNLYRDVKKNENGTEQIKIVYPKFKNGEATVRSVRVKPKFDYVDDIYQTYIKAQQDGKLTAAAKELVDMCPAPMNTMLQKQPRAEAIQKQKQRRSMTVQDVPATAPVQDDVTVQQDEDPQLAGKVPKPRYCSICKKPLKGHKKNFPDCPRNKELQAKKKKR